MNPELSIIIPCYKAPEFLEENIDKIGSEFQKLENFELIAVDDGSGDGSSEILHSLANTRPWLKPVIHPVNCGKGRAILSGFGTSTGKWIIMNDIDLQYDVADMRQCFEKLAKSGNDLVIGSRMHPRSIYHIKSSQLRYIFTRHVFSRILNFVLRKTLIPNVKDTQCGLKGFSRKFVDFVKEGRAEINGFAFDVELLVIARANSFSVSETPVHFRYTDIPSTIKFLKVGSKLSIDLLHIFANLLSGRYKRKDSIKRTAILGEFSHKI
ncbi:MAG: glycosyltransferase family 2 protein [Candidatus Riflebacteria bacterium]|nr:glycosyltransferase family 2 protein [Candidatus Riflebacteria bacterium]